MPAQLHSLLENRLNDASRVASEYLFEILYQVVGGGLLEADT